MSPVQSHEQFAFRLLISFLDLPSVHPESDTAVSRSRHSLPAFSASITNLAWLLCWVDTAIRSISGSAQQFLIIIGGITQTVCRSLACAPPTPPVVASPRNSKSPVSFIIGSMVLRTKLPAPIQSQADLLTG